MTPPALPATDDPTERVTALVEAARKARNDQRRQGDELRPLGAKAQRTRASLLRAAYDRFVDAGYVATSVEDIQEATGVSIGTFYQYFRDKADVMTTLVAEAIIASSEQMFGEPDTVWSTSRVERVVENFIRNYAHTAGFQAVWEEATHHEDALAAFRRDVTRVVEASLAAQIVNGQRSGAVGATVDPYESARALAAMVDRYCYLTFVVEDRCDEDSIAAVNELVLTLWRNALVLEDEG